VRRQKRRQAANKSPPPRRRQMQRRRSARRRRLKTATPFSSHSHSTLTPPKACRVAPPPTPPGETEGPLPSHSKQLGIFFDSLSPYVNKTNERAKTRQQTTFQHASNLRSSNASPKDKSTRLFPRIRKKKQPKIPSNPAHQSNPKPQKPSESQKEAPKSQQISTTTQAPKRQRPPTKSQDCSLSPKTTQQISMPY
jgi:hypothetical protein